MVYIAVLPGADLLYQEIYCNTDHLGQPNAQQADPDIVLWDNAQDLPVRKGNALLELRDANSDTNAITRSTKDSRAADGGPLVDKAEEIVLHPQRLANLIRNAMTPDRITKASRPQLAEKLENLMKNLKTTVKGKPAAPRVSGIDFLTFSLEHVMLHEVSCALSGAPKPL
jgi:hypothetical protein